VAKNWSWPLLASPTPLPAARRQAVDQGAISSGRSGRHRPRPVPGAQGGCVKPVVSALTQSPLRPAQSIMSSANRAPERWSWRSPPLGRREGTGAIRPDRAPPGHDRGDSSLAGPTRRGSFACARD
jgi:hypothetical protein